MDKKINVNLKGSPPVEMPAQDLTGLKALNALGIDNTESLVAVKINGEIKDLSLEVNSSAELEPVYLESQDGLSILRHSTAHVMAEAVRDLFPGTKVTIGPAIKNGFYYDFDYERAFEAKDLP